MSWKGREGQPGEKRRKAKQKIKTNYRERDAGNLPQRVRARVGGDVGGEGWQEKVKKIGLLNI